LATHRGFILQPTYRVESGRPVVHLYGRLEDGRPFLVRDRRAVPRFHIEKKDAERARRLGAVRQVTTDCVTLTGQPLVAVEVPTPADTPPLRDRLVADGIAAYEADVRFAMRYLIERGIRGALEIGGDGRPVPGLGVVFGLELDEIIGACKQLRLFGR
jgi:DNA polymerase-2